MRITKAGLAFLLLFGVSPAWAGSGVMTPAAGASADPCDDYKNWVCLDDDFVGGGTGAGQIGRLGWSHGGATAPTAPASEANRIGIIQKASAASVGQFGYLYLNTTQGVLINGTSYLHYEARLNTNDSDTRFRLGAMYLVNTDPTDGQYLEKLEADTNWFCVTRAASSQTRTDTGVAVTTGFYALDVNRTGNSAVEFKLNGATVCNHTTNLPTSQALTIGAQVRTAATSAKTFDVDYFKGRIAVTR